jgi:hypothetical protein
VRSLDDAVRANDLKKVKFYIGKGEYFAAGGILPVVLAAHLG